MSVGGGGNNFGKLSFHGKSPLGKYHYYVLYLTHLYQSVSKQCKIDYIVNCYFMRLLDFKSSYHAPSPAKEKYFFHYSLLSP